jgi:hypothetical protein
MAERCGEARLVWHEGTEAGSNPARRFELSNGSDNSLENGIHALAEIQIRLSQK